MPELPLIGDEFAGFRLRSILGRGGMSVVYRGENPRLGNVIALKVLAPELASDDVFRTRFLAESRIAAAMNHPHVIPIHDMGSSDGLLYIAMRCVTGTDLQHMLREEGRLPPDTAIFLLRQAARALDAAHRRGLVHRDVKPANLLVERGGDDSEPDHVYLADFGITTPEVTGHSGLTSPGQFLGSSDYVAPEQVRGLPVLGLADQYSLGCVLYECLTGRVPFEKALDAEIIRAHVEELPVPPTRLRPGLPPAIDDVLARALAKRPGDRFENCRAFLAAAGEALEPVTARRPAVMAAPPGAAYAARLPVLLSAPVMAAGYEEIAHGRLGTGPLGSRPLASGPFASGPFASDPLASGPFASGPFGPAPPGDDRVRGAAGDRRGPGRRDLRAPLLALAVAMMIAAAAGIGAVLGLSREPAQARPAGPAAARTAAAPTPAPAVTTSGRPASALLSALAPVQNFTGRLSLSACLEPSPTLVTCASPDPKGAIASATFQTFPDLGSLYVAYQADVAAMAREPFPKVENTQNCGSPAPQPMGEISWNHTDQHTLGYSVAQLAAGAVPYDIAAGRMFCLQLPGGGENIIWTQNVGRLLVVAHGAASHEQVWLWFVAVHHNIAFKGQPAMAGMPMG